MREATRSGCESPVTVVPDTSPVPSSATGLRRPVTGGRLVCHPSGGREGSTHGCQGPPRAIAVAGGGPRHGAGGARGRVRRAQRPRDLSRVARRRPAHPAGRRALPRARGPSSTTRSGPPKGPPSPTHSEVRAVHPPDRLELEVHAGPVKGTVEFELERTGEGTLVTFRERVTGAPRRGHAGAARPDLPSQQGVARQAAPAVRAARRAALRAAIRLPHQRVTWSITSVAMPSPPRWLSSWRTNSVPCLRSGHEPLGVGQRDDVVGVAVPPADRRLDVVRLEAPVAGEEDPVGDERPHAATAVLR